MRQFIRQNVLGLTALFVALGGTAYATHPGGENTISSGDIINGQVRTPDLRDQEVTASKLAPSSVGSANIINGQVRTEDIRNDAVDINKLAPNSVGTNKVVNESLIGTDILDQSLTGNDVNEAQLDVAQFDVPLRRGGDSFGEAESPVTLLTLPGVGSFRGFCTDFGGLTIHEVRFRNESPDPEGVALYNPLSSDPYDHLSNGEEATVDEADGSSEVTVNQVAIGEGLGDAVSAVVTGFSGGAGFCVANVLAIG